jgi:uncharacterized membrane protein YdjX (TVP38/TMEM64 family)
MATDNPRAVDDSTLANKDHLNRVVFYVSALLILTFALVTIFLMTLPTTYSMWCWLGSVINSAGITCWQQRYI